METIKDKVSASDDVKIKSVNSKKKAPKQQQSKQSKQKQTKQKQAGQKQAGQQSPKKAQKTPREKRKLEEKKHGFGRSVSTVEDIIDLDFNSPYIGFIDFEATCWENKRYDFRKGEIPEILSVGLIVCENSAVEFPIVETFYTICKLHFNPVLSDFCIDLTGVKSEDTENGINPDEALSKVLSIVKQYHLKNLYVWTNGDDGLLSRQYSNFGRLGYDKSLITNIRKLIVNIEPALKCKLVEKGLLTKKNKGLYYLVDSTCGSVEVPNGVVGVPLSQNYHYKDLEYGDFKSYDLTDDFKEYCHTPVVDACLLHELFVKCMELYYEEIADIPYFEDWRDIYEEPALLLQYYL